MTVPVGSRCIDERIEERIRAGCDDAWADAFAAFREPLRRFAFRHVRSHDTASDVVQDVFCNVWRTRARLELRDGLSAYLYRATRNRALDLLNQDAVRRRWAERAGEADAVVEHPVDVAEPDEMAGAEQLARTIDGVLARMPERRQLVCRLRWRDHVAPAEIAARLGLSLKTVETQITRGRRELKRALTEEGRLL